MLKIQPDSRQVPSVRMYTANKKYYDLLYGVLQEISYLDYTFDGLQRRFINKKDIKFTDLANRVGLTRQSASTKFKNLISLGLVEFVEDENRYILNSLDSSEASLIPFSTLRQLNNSLNQNSISIYVYILKLYFANGQKPFGITLNQLKIFVGLSEKSRSNSEIIKDILNTLILLGLIELEIKYFDDKTHIIITKVNNVIEEKITGI